MKGKGAIHLLGSRDVFAERVVNDLLKGASGRIYRGSLSTTMAVLKNWLPEWIMVSILGVSPFIYTYTRRGTLNVA